MKICFYLTAKLIQNIILLKKLELLLKFFEEHWNDVYLKNKTLIDEMRPNADYEINKIIDCANKSLGCAAYFW